MSLDNLSSFACRFFFLGAFLLLGLGVLEAADRLLGFTILRGLYTSGRLMEISAVLMIFVISLLLRQLREALSK